MFIIYGSKVYGRKNLVRGWGHCDSCGEYSRRKNYTGRKWGHLYYIPLFPAGGRVRVTKECAKCGQGYHIPEANVSAVVADFCQCTERAIHALLAGQDTFDDEGTPTPCVPFLVNAAETFHVLASPDRVEWVLTSLQENNLTYAYHRVHGETIELMGDLSGAAVVYKQSLQEYPGDEQILRSLANASLLTGDHPEALNALERVLELSEDRDDRLNLRQLMIDVHEAMGNYDKAIEGYETCFELSPKLAKDKKFKKAYKKACKKANKAASPYHTRGQDNR